MSEMESIKKLDIPLTRDSLAADLRNLGVQPGMTLLVHSSLSKLGWVCGGQVAVIYALMDALTSEGTLVMPTHSGDLSDPEPWENPPYHNRGIKPFVTPCQPMIHSEHRHAAWVKFLNCSAPGLMYYAVGIRKCLLPRGVNMRNL